MLTSLYYGALCIQKYLKNPVTVNKELVPLSEMPPLQMSFCKRVKLADCTTSPPFYPNLLFSYDNSYEYYYDDEPGKNTFF